MMGAVKGRNVVACFIGSGSMQSRLHASQGNAPQIFAIMLTAMGEWIKCSFCAIADMV